MEPSLELLKDQLKKVLSRDVGVEKLKSGKYICKYVAYGMSPLALVGATEAEAYQKLAQHLKIAAAKLPDPEPTPAA